MTNQYGQTNILAQYLAQQPQRHHTGLGTALRLGGAAIANYAENQRQEKRKSALADALRGMNREVLGPIDERGAMGPRADAPVMFDNPDQLASMLMTPETSNLATALINREMNPPKPEAYTLSPGQQRYVGGEMVASVPAAEPNPTDSMLEYELAQQQGFDGTYADYLTMSTRKAPSGFSFGENGALAPIPGGPADPAYIAETAPLKRPQTTIKMPKGETEFEKATGKDLAAARTAIVEAGQNAVGTEQTFRQLGNLLESGVRTGALQPAVKALQGIADDMGVDLSGTAQALGIELGDLADQQNFQRLATQVVIDGFEQFKGNLNQREVEIAERAFGGLGTTPEANADAIAAGIAASQIARERAVMASRAQTQADVRVLQESLISGDVAGFENRKAAIKAKLLEARDGELPTIQGDADYDALPTGTQFRAPDGSIRVKP